MKNQNKTAGFTLLEILLALFIFSLLSLILASALRTVINAQEGSERHAERLRHLQVTLLMMSRDLEQAVNRPIYNESGKVEKAFIGEPSRVILTHTGLVNPEGELNRSSLQRTAYAFSEYKLIKTTWSVLDQAPKSKSSKRVLLQSVDQLRFQYLDAKNKFHDNWPLDEDTGQVLPKAVKVSISIADWGEVSQLYVVSAENSPDEKKKP